MPRRNTAPTSEEGRVPELSDHVAGLDFHEVVLWAKQQDISADESLNNMLGIKPITIDGLPAAVGWLKRDPDHPTGLLSSTPPIKIEKPGGVDIVIVEGSFVASIESAGQNMPAEIVGARWVETEPNWRPGFLQLDGGDTVQASDISSNDGGDTCWFVCFYPEAPSKIASEN